MAARTEEDVSVLEVRVLMTEWMERLGMDPSFASRHLNEGFSGGEKKRNEILQMALLEPELAVLDETDSGLDIDALRVVGRGVHAVREERPELGVLVITHYQRLLDELIPDFVHLLVDGRIVTERWPRAGQAGGGRRVRGMAMTTLPLNVEALRKDFPLLDPQVHDRPHRLPRLGILGPAAPVGHRRHGALLRDDARQRAPRRLRHRRGGHPPVRARPRRWSVGSSAPPDPAHEIVFTKNTTESINLVAHTWGRANLKAGRRASCSPRWSTTPTSCPG